MSHHSPLGPQVPSFKVNYGKEYYPWEGENNKFLIYFISLVYVLFLFYFNFSILFYYFEYFIKIIIYNINILSEDEVLVIINTSLLPFHVVRYSNGRFKGKSLKFVPLDAKLIEALIEELLGDGHLRFNTKNSDGKPKPNTNAQLAMTLKFKEHVYYLCQEIQKSICTMTPPHPWPNPKTGKPTTQYHFSSKALKSISKINSEWYQGCEKSNKFVKIVPSNIGELLTPLGLAHWLMGDGYWVNYA